MIPSSILQAIAARPDDLVPRAVWGDALLERGEPQGEFIALSLTLLARRASFLSSYLQRWRSALRDLDVADEQVVRRMNQLRLKHQRQWMGPLHPVTKYVEFYGGLLDSIGLSNEATASPALWAIAADAPQLNTVRTFLKGKGRPERMAEFLRRGRLLCLRTLEVSGPPVLDAVLAGHASTVTHLVFSRWWKKIDPAAVGLSLPHLTHVSLPFDDLKTTNDFVDRARAPMHPAWEVTVSDCHEMPDFARHSSLETLHKLTLSNAVLERAENGWSLLFELSVSTEDLEGVPDFVTRLTVPVLHRREFEKQLRVLRKRGMRVFLQHLTGDDGRGGQTTEFA